jgi:hypothetical protein
MLVLTILIIVSCAVGAIVLIRNSRKDDPTIGTYSDVKNSVIAGTAVPLNSQVAFTSVIGKSLADFDQIEDVHERYLEMGSYLTDKAIELGEDSYTEQERVIRLVWNLESEVNNGGFDQYFFNSTGDFAAETLVHLKAMGAMEYHNSLKSAVDLVFDGGVPEEREKRWEVLGKLTDEQREKLDAIDSDFCKILDPIEQCVIDYLLRIEEVD